MLLLICIKLIHFDGLGGMLASYIGGPTKDLNNQLPDV